MNKLCSFCLVASYYLSNEIVLCLHDWLSSISREQLTIPRLFGERVLVGLHGNYNAFSRLTGL